MKHYIKFFKSITTRREKKFFHIFPYSYIKTIFVFGNNKFKYVFNYVYSFFKDDEKEIELYVEEYKYSINDNRFKTYTIDLIKRFNKGILIEVDKENRICKLTMTIMDKASDLFEKSLKDEEYECILGLYGENFVNENVAMRANRKNDYYIAFGTYEFIIKYVQEIKERYADFDEIIMSDEFIEKFGVYFI